jgi:hypothetical protein
MRVTVYFLCIKERFLVKTYSHEIYSEKEGEYPIMTNDSGLLSIDFLIGFSIFMLTIIAVATFASGLLVGLQSKTIDYDAVAYRTGVILAEDPGQPNAFPGVVVLDPQNEWEFIGSSQKDKVLRFGLSIYKSDPRIFSPTKILSFNNPTVYTSLDDYRTRMIFGTYPYHFNVTITNETGTILAQKGEPYNYYSTYGYIRRVVLIKEPGQSKIDAFPYKNASDNLPFRVFIYSTQLFDARRGPTYWIDPMKEELRINLTNLSSVAVNGDNVTLNTLTFSYYSNISGAFISPPGNDLRSYAVTDKGMGPSPIAFNQIHYVNLTIPAGYFIGKTSEIAGNQVTIRINYNFLTTANFNNTFTQANYYFPLPPGVHPQPILVPAIMEVRIW